ncbi:beta strand repeat-containing protein [Gluconacetobacter asukensis]|uniref:Matrixin family metalloprotease n=1 Tax=Gluconacetobacter asukensis TaxID=1017181 RepID=A0A7W4J3V3_9PROT|nr:matrixin family metalloprotease [Gluconacetobacter asukensis]MBB2174250.1 matrixin family metalloprotease [Gluconacetobacter asukensis]
MTILKRTLRAYGQLASGVAANNTFFGNVANQNLESYYSSQNSGSTIGFANYQLTVAYELERQDWSMLSSQNGLVLTEAQVAQEHAVVFNNMNIPLSYWGGTIEQYSDISFMQNFGTAWEESSVVDTGDFGNPSWSQWSSAAWNFVGAFARGFAQQFSQNGSFTVPSFTSTGLKEGIAVFEGELNVVLQVLNAGIRYEWSEAANILIPNASASEVTFKNANGSMVADVRSVTNGDTKGYISEGGIFAAVGTDLQGNDSLVTATANDGSGVSQGNVTADGIVDIASPNQSVVGTDGSQIVLSGSGDMVNVSSGQVTIATNTQAGVSGSGDTITENAGDALAIFGGGSSISTNGNARVWLTQTGDNYSTVWGSNLGYGTAADGETEGVYLDNNTRVNVVGSQDQLVVGTGAALAIFGGGSSISTNGNARVWLTQTGNNYSTVWGSNLGYGTAADGETEGVYLDNNTRVNVVGSQDQLVVGTGAALAIFGGGSSITTNGNARVWLTQTGNNYSTVWGSNLGNGTAADGEAEGVYLDNNSQATVNGNDDQISAGTGAVLTINGTGDTVTSGDGGTVTLYDASNDSFTPGSNATIDIGGGSNNDSFNMEGTGDTVDVVGSDETIGGAIYGASEETFTFADNTSGNTLDGNDDQISAGTSASLTIDGTGDTVSNGNGSTLTLSNASNNSFTPGSNATINIGGGSNNNGFNMVGTGDTVIDDGSNNTFNGAIAGANDETFAFGDNSSGNVVTGSNLAIHLGNNLSLTVTGNNDTFTGGDGDRLNIVGSNDTVNTNDALVTFSGSDDKVIGTGDAESGGAYTYTTTYVTSYTYTVFYGLDAGVTKPVNAIGQYDLSHGLSADAADMAWSLDEQAIRAGTGDPGAVAPSLLVGGLVDSHHPVTWSFSETAPRGIPLYGGTIQGAYQAAVEQALDTWSKASGIDFEQVSDSASSDIRIGWGNLDTTNTGVAGVTLLRASAGTLRPGTMIELETPLQDPLTQTSPGAFTYAGSSVGLEQLALHEIGHALGLAESASPTSIMYPLLGTHNITLNTSDMSDIAVLYHTAHDAAATSSMIQAMASFTGAATPAHTSVLSSPSNAEPLLSVPAHTS